MEAIICHNYDPRWDEFVSTHPAGTFFHQWKWREVIASAFGYEPYYLMAEDGGKPAGVLPLFLVRSLLFGRSLVALPLAVYGGVVAGTLEAETLLIQKAMAIANDVGAKYLELRGNPYLDRELKAPDGASETAIKQKDLYVTFIGEIDPSDEANFNRIPRKQRRMVRQGEKHGLKAVIDNSRLREFYKVYAASVRNLGTPVYGYPYFEKLVKSFGEALQSFLDRAQRQGRGGSHGVLLQGSSDAVLRGRVEGISSISPPTISCTGKSCAMARRRVTKYSISDEARREPGRIISNATGGLSRVRYRISIIRSKAAKFPTRARSTPSSNGPYAFGAACR